MNEQAKNALQHSTSHSARSVAELIESGHLDASERLQLEQVASRFAVAITPAMLELMSPGDTNDPLAQQFLPATAELQAYAEARSDPIGDQIHSPLPGIVHRYPDRLLLMPLRVCPVYCRFCFRRETVGPAANNAPLSNSELEAALDYVREQSGVWEVILSGGDPLLLSPRRLAHILKRLAGISHVRVVRIHTRIPVVDPERISTDLLSALRSTIATYVVLHCNHSRELSPAARLACARLVDSGIPMLSQTVLLRGINDDVASLESLMRALVENRIKPYYLHHADKASGTAHFQTTVGAGQQLLRQLRGRVSGLCQPEYVLDIPGGAGKTPIGPVWIEDDPGNGYKVYDYKGCEHSYQDNGKDTPAA